MLAQRIVAVAGAPLASALIAAALLVSTAGGASAGPMMAKTGDLNMDGTANSIDALYVLWYQVTLQPMPGHDDPLFIAGDVNCDELLNSVDASLILQHTAGLINLRP